MNLDRKYNIILADPPWPNNKRNPNKKFGKGAAGHYDCLSLKEICSINIKNICDENAILFLWGMCSQQESAHKVIEAWGFKRKTTAFVWIKINKNGSLWKGLGNYTACGIEEVHLATRGKVLLPERKLVAQTFLSPKLKHSQKPDVVHERIDEMYGLEYNKVELFARRNYKNWDCTGNQLDNFDLREL